MKKVILASLLCFFSLLSQAQIVENLEYPSFHFGIRGAYTSNRAFFSGDGTSDSKIFGSLGLAMDFRIASIPLYLETGWYYMNKGWEGSEDCDYDGGYDTDNHSVIMPMLASYHLYLTDNMSIQPFAGPYIGYGVDEERFDYGLRTGIGWNLGRLYVNTGYDFGFEREGYRTGTYFCTVGFNFCGGY